MDMNTLRVLLVGAAAGAMLTGGGVAVGLSLNQPALADFTAAPAGNAVPASVRAYVKKQVGTRAPAKVTYRKPVAKPLPAKNSRARLAMPADDDLTPISTVEAAGSAVRSIVVRYSVPNGYGTDGRRRLLGAACPAEAPIYIGWSAWSSNYSNEGLDEGFLVPLNSDGTVVAGFASGSARAVLSFFKDASPKDGPLDLYVAQLCAPVMEPVP